jgi:hypothetical protein
VSGHHGEFRGHGPGSEGPERSLGEGGIPEAVETVSSIRRTPRDGPHR